MATQAQFDEKLRQDREGLTSSADAATPTQLAEKTRQDSSSLDQIATPAQLAEKALREPQYASLPGATSAQLAEKSQRGRPPPLPPRDLSTTAPPAYSYDDAVRSELISNQWRSNDPRSSSTHSLVPSESARDGRRTLLLVFIHGFMGNESSFQSFPAHVHNFLTITLADTHVVHTKIYPRYKSRKAIEFARNDFSDWLEPHENKYTDVILLGHSMGGLLSAEVTLQKPPTPEIEAPFRHRILGTINFDTPFLGMHPGVIVSGIGSLFRPAPEPTTHSRQASVSGTLSPVESRTPASTPSHAPSIAESDASSQISLVQSITSPLATPSPNDPFFNAPFPNDVRLPERKGWTNLLHFVTKHSDGLTTATKQYFMSHIEFGGCMADYPGLKARYGKIRALEDVDDTHRSNEQTQQPPIRRVRFVNYYTASTGRPKPPKPPPAQMLDAEGNSKPVEDEMQNMNLERSRSHSLTPTPSITVDEVDTQTAQKSAPDTGASAIETQMQSLGESSGVHDDFQEPPAMRHIDSMPIDEDDSDEDIFHDTTPMPSIETEEPKLEPAVSEPPLPPVPAEPTEPDLVDLSLYTDKDARKIAEKEYKRVMKAYQQAVKDRESAIKDRKKLLEKREKKIRQEREKKLKAEEKQRLKEEKEEEKRKITINPTEVERERQASTASSEAVRSDKPKRDKKFCMLPPEYGGKRDKCWIRVYMDGVDEVGAHCGLFFQGPQYESLVGDVGDRIGKWIEEAASKRA